MTIDFNVQSTEEILAILKRKGLKIQFRLNSKAVAPSTLEIKDTKYSDLLEDLVYLRSFLEAA